MSHRSLKVASLFSGIGGLDLGLEQAGHQIILQCEIDPGAQQVLKKRWPGTLLVPDVCSLASLPPETDLLAAGFPCIDISRAGLKQGLAGQSSGLVAHVFRLLKRAKDDGKPIAWVLLENVEALLDRAGGRTPAIKAITDQLEEIGYHSWAHRVICSAGFGLPNRRKRVFVMASLHGDARDVLLAQGRQKCMGSCTSGSNDKHCYECYQPPIKSVKSSSNEAASSSSALTELEDIDLSDCSLALDLGNARSAPGIDIVPTFTTQNERMCLILPSGKIGMLRTDDAERLQGLPSGHTKPCWPIVGPGVQQHRSKQIKDADKDSIARARFALIGNAVTVSVARWIGIRLADPYAHKYIASCDDFALPASFTGPGGGPSLKEREDQQEVRVATASVILRQNKKVVPSIFDLPGINGSEEEDAEEGNWDVEEANEGQEAHEDDLEGRGKGPVDPKLLLKRQKETLQEARKDDEDSEDEGDEKHAYGGVAGSKKDGSWPRVAWFLKGHGRFGVTGVSENPVKVPFRPLGEVVKDVGMAPSAEALTVFIQRLREQGWNLAPTIQRIKECGTTLDPQVLSVVRLVDQAMDCDKLGWLVWAKDPSRELGAWWPAEMFDPWNLPAGVGITASQILGLKLRDRPLFLPPWILGGDKALPPSDQSLEDKGRDSVEKQVDAAMAPKGRRKFLVVFFGDKRESHWEFSDCVLDFKEHRDQKVEEMEGLLRGRMVNCGSLFKRALYHADQAHSLKQQMGFGEAGVDGKTRAISAKANGATIEFTSNASHAMAAMQAALVNKQARCEQCEACLASNGPNGQKIRRRCLVIRAQAAAAAGHTGAQLAVLGRRSIGARISVWWPLDEEWYSGFVTGFDSRRVRHEIYYDDEEYELICLWSPGQLIRVVNNPCEWESEAERIDKERGERKKMQQIDKEAKAAVKVDDENEVEEARTDAEMERAQRIKENKTLMNQLLSDKNVEESRGVYLKDGATDDGVVGGGGEGWGGARRKRARGEVASAAPDDRQMGGELPVRLPRELRGLLD